ncbi:O-antigen ligase family protein [Chitinophaga silvisoli]|uniref:O-antigen ligase domain-containing protein n=1 Tax=Chitinophaga silvisoli TaxID=2291814 RepID=A0A3E1P0G2_9BACT|nr:O-antigen ligase family protein [Chitinophaga silvisoli]RFM33662.1 O-antigen ligase domain-containing protein [Chitinophaga silvisoli]
MNRINVLLFLYAFSAIVCFDYESLTIIPKIFAGLMIVEYFIQTLHMNRPRVKGPFNWGLGCLVFLSVYSLISFAFFPYDLPGEAIINIMMILVLSYILTRIVDNVRAFDMVLVGLSLGLFIGFIMNIFVPQVDDWGRTSRYVGTLGNSNLFSLMVNFCISFLLQRYKLYSKFWRSLILIFIILAAQQVMMSGSKLGLFMYLLNVLYLVFYIRIIKNTTTLVFISILLVSLSGFFITNFLMDNSEAFDRFTYLQDVFSGNREYSESDLLRYNLAVKGWDMWTQRPFFGWGYGAFVFLGGYNLYSHNNMVELLANTGIFGFLIFHAALIQLVVMAYRSDIYRKNSIVWTIYFALMVIISSFAIVLFGEKLFWLLYFTMVAYLKMHTVQREIPVVTVHQLN